MLYIRKILKCAWLVESIYVCWVFFQSEPELELVYEHQRTRKKNEKKLPVQSERWLHEKRLDKERLVSVHVALRTAFWQHALFTINNTEKDRFFLEVQLHFDSTEEVFITNIVTCILNSFFSLLTCIGNFIVVFVIGKTRSELKSAKSNLYISAARLLKNSKSSRRSLGTLSPILSLLSYIILLNLYFSV